MDGDLVSIKLSRSAVGYRITHCDSHSKSDVSGTMDLSLFQLVLGSRNRNRIDISY